MRKLKNLKHIFFIIILSLSFIFGSFLMFSNEFNDSMNGFFIYRTSGGVWQDKIYKHTLRPSSDDIVIVKIDERTLNELQNNSNDLKNLGFTKKTYTDIVTNLENVGVRGIAFDIIFQNPDSNYEQDFADTMAKYDNIVIGVNYIENLCLGAYGAAWVQLGTETYKGVKYPKTISNQDCESQYKKIKLAIGEKLKEEYSKEIMLILQKPESLTHEEQLTLYCSSSLGITDCPGLPRSLYKRTSWGIINTPSSYERTLSAPILEQPYERWKLGSGSYRPDDTMMHTLMMQLYKNTNSGTALNSSELPYYKQRLKRGVDAVPDAASFRTILQPYFGAENESYPSISLIDVLRMNKVERKTNFAGKYVLIGESGTIIHDEHLSPVTGHKIDGIETHAHFLDGLLQDKMLKRASISTLWIVTVSLSIICIFAYFYLPTYLSLSFAIVGIISTLWISRYIYDAYRILIDIFPLFLSVFFATFTTTYIYRFFVVDREKRYIENAFGHYIDPKMVEMIDAEQVSVSLGGEERELSVFFSDIAGFTSISEKLSVENLFSLMSYYLSKMTGILKGEGGTLDKYIGDAVMGFFGAPVIQADHAVRACNTAIKMRKMLPEINEEVTRRGLEPIDFRVGIASGKVMVGNIGSTEHFNYTVLGDVVNLASRLEATGKEYNVHIIISEGTRLHIGERFELRELDTIAVKGKTEGIRIYELLGILGEVGDRDIYKKYEEALDLYRRGRYIDAGQLWESQMDQDPPSRVMALRCVDILKGNIQVENGIYHMTHK